MDFGIASVAGIMMICYLAGMGLKASAKVKNEVIPHLPKLRRVIRSRRKCVKKSRSILKSMI